MDTVDVRSLQARRREPGLQLLDVREEWEYAIAHIEGSIHIPMGEIPARLDEIDPERPVAVLCHHGMRSLYVARFLESHGFGRVTNVEGGIDAWARDVEPGMARY